METFVLIAQLLLGIIISVLVILQTQSSGAGSVFGSDTSVYRTRRGLEKTLYQATIVVGVLFFIISIVAARLV